MLCTKSAKSICTRGALVLSLALSGTLSFLTFSDTGHAAEQDKKYADRKTRKTPAMGLKVGNALGEAQEMAEQENWAEAEKILEDKLGAKLDSLNSYETAQYYNFKGYLSYSRGDYQAAKTYYHDVLQQENLPVALEDQVMYTLAQLHFVTEDYHDCVSYMKRWLEVQPEPSENAMIIIGQCLYAGAEKNGTRDDYREGIEYVSRAIELRNGKNKLPEENWYLLLRAMYFGLGDYENAVRIQETLLENWPKKDYWVQLAGLYGQLSAGEGLSVDERKLWEKKQLIIYQEAYDRGYLTRESEILDLARMMMYHDIPYLSAKVVDQGIRSDQIAETKPNLELEAQAWQTSQEIEKSIHPLSRAAQLSEDGRLYVFLAKSFLRQGDPDQAVNSLLKALEKDKLRSEGDAHFTLGLAYYNMEQTGKARQAFLRAAEFEETRKAGLQWARFMDREAQRLATRKEYLGY